MISAAASISATFFHCFTLLKNIVVKLYYNSIILSTVYIIFNFCANLILSCSYFLSIIANGKLVFPCKFLCIVITHDFALILLNNACYSAHINPYFVIAFFLALIKHKLKSEMQMTFGYSVCIFGIAVTRSSHITDYIACINLVTLF